jgi:hypothetical protein
VGWVTGTNSDTSAELVRAASDVLAGRATAQELEEVFARSRVCAQRPASLGVFVVEVAGRGRWAPVFSTPERLARYAGDCEFFVTTGADLVAQLPAGVGVMLDCQDPHGVALTPP